MNSSVSISSLSLYVLLSIVTERYAISILFSSHSLAEYNIDESDIILII